MVILTHNSIIALEQYKNVSKVDICIMRNISAAPLQEEKQYSKNWRDLDRIMAEFGAETPRN